MARPGKTWWGQRFIEALEGFTDRARLQRGRGYSGESRILAFAIADGVVSATVRGNVNPYFGVYKEPRYQTRKLSDDVREKAEEKKALKEKIKQKVKEKAAKKKEDVMGALKRKLQFVRRIINYIYVWWDYSCGALFDINRDLFTRIIKAKSPKDQPSAFQKAYVIFVDLMIPVLLMIYLLMFFLAVCWSIPMCQALMIAAGAVIYLTS